MLFMLAFSNAQYEQKWMDALFGRSLLQYGMDIVNSLWVFLAILNYPPSLPPADGL